MRSDQIAHWEAVARKGFTYKADGAKTVAQDKWFSRGDEALAGKPWTGDCANLASTVLDLCTRAGAALADCYFLVVKTTDGQGHAVGSIKDDAGKHWVVGDTFEHAPYPVDQMKHIPVDYHRDSESIGIWRAGAPWAVTS